MKLNFGQIQALTKGAEYLSEEADGLCFHRFTPKDDASSTPDSPSICLADAGIKLAFRTNSRYLRIKGKTFLVNSIRSFYAIDLVKDGVLVDSIQNTSENELSPFISTNEYPLGYFEKEFALGNGEKSIELHLPHSTGCLLSELSIEDGADISPLPAQKVWLAYGDSITQGYDVLHPTQRYTALLCKRLQMDEYNKAIAGACFPAHPAPYTKDLSPSIISVAYGTNDFSHRGLAAFRKDAEAFITSLAKTYPLVPKFILSPILRADSLHNERFGDLHEAANALQALSAGLPYTYFICGEELVPNKTSSFGDGYLHPGEVGFAHYAENLYQKIMSFI